MVNDSHARRDGRSSTLVLQQKLLKNYNLCKHCFERHASSGGRKNKTTTTTTTITAAAAAATTTTAKSCYICRGLMNEIDSIVDGVIMPAIEGYEFDTFLIGATLPTQMYEREDAMRARLKIRGTESIKNHLTRELGIRLAEMTKKKVDYMKPDITINLTVSKENNNSNNHHNVSATVKSRPLTLIGRYIKRSRGLPQKQDKCPYCEGKGCDSCSYSGLSGSDSVEGIIAEALMAATKGQTPRFSWVGSEDQSSLVLGRGRPFYVRIFNPKIRKLKKGKKSLRVKDSRVKAVLYVLRSDGNFDDSNDYVQLKSYARFIVKTRIYVECKGTLTRNELKKLNLLAGVQVSFKGKSKTVTKKIYTIRARQAGNNNDDDDNIINNNNKNENNNGKKSQFVLTITADGGLPIKQFVGGEEYIKPNVTEILGTKCECVTFDVLEVKPVQ